MGSFPLKWLKTRLKFRFFYAEIESMLRKAYLLIFFLSNLLGCAQRDETLLTQRFHSNNPEESLLKCMHFSDETFNGVVHASFSASGEIDPYCVKLEIFQSPKSLFNSEELFVQAYPLLFDNETPVYGTAMNFEIYKKSHRDPVLSSRILEAQLVKKLKSTPNRFFRDHYFKLCSDDLEEWEAMQLIVYFEKNEKYDDVKHSPIRVTRFLIPPFLSNPNYYRKEQGDALVALHPYLHSQQKINEGTDEFFDHTSSLCE